MRIISYVDLAIKKNNNNEINVIVFKKNDLSKELFSFRVENVIMVNFFNKNELTYLKYEKNDPRIKSWLILKVNNILLIDIESEIIYASGSLLE